MRSYRFAVLRNARKSVTESIAKNGKNDLISGSLDSVFLSGFMRATKFFKIFPKTIDF